MASLYKAFIKGIVDDALLLPFDQSVTLTLLSTNFKLRETVHFRGNIVEFGFDAFLTFLYLASMSWCALEAARHIFCG